VFELFWKLYQREKQAHPDQPIFFFVLTIHQHGPAHDTVPGRWRRPYDKPLFAKQLDDWQSLNVTNYLERKRRSDARSASSSSACSIASSPPCLMHFGDTSLVRWRDVQPQKALPPDWGDNQQLATYYMLKTNYPVAQKYDTR
jgi:hypothetical protein